MPTETPQPSDAEQLYPGLDADAAKLMMEQGATGNKEKADTKKESQPATPDKDVAAAQAKAAERRAENAKTEAAVKAKEQEDFAALYGGLDPETLKTMQAQGAVGSPKAEKGYTRSEAPGPDATPIAEMPEHLRPPKDMETHTMNAATLEELKNTQAKRAAEQQQAAAPEGPVEQAADTTPKTPEEVQSRVTEITARMKDIDGQLKDPKLPPEIRTQLETEKSELKKEFQELVPPATVGEKLERDMDNAMEEFAKGNMLALAKVIGSLVQYLNLSFKGGLDESLDKKATDKPAAPKEGEGKEGENKTDKQRIEDELKARAAKEAENKKPDEQPKATIDIAARNVEGLQGEKREKIEKNNENIASLDKKIDAAKDENNKLISDKAVLEQQLNSMRGDESKATEVKAVEAQLEAVNQKIAANTKLIDTLDKMRDELKAENKNLESDVKILDTMKNDIDKGNAKIKDILDHIAKIWAERFPGSPPNIAFDFNADGSLKSVNVTNADKNLVAALPKGKTDSDGSVTVLPDDFLKDLIKNKPVNPKIIEMGLEGKAMA